MSVVDVRNPGTGELLGQVEAMASERVTAVVDRAQQGQRAMAALPAHERAALLHQIARVMESEKDSLATLLAKENGNLHIPAAAANLALNKPATAST